MAHAKYAPSQLARISRCAASSVLSEGIKDETSFVAAEGSAAHFLGDRCLSEDRSAISYLGEVIEVDGFTFVVDEDMADHVQEYVDYVRFHFEEGDILLVEQKLSVEHITGEKDAKGTVDALIVKHKEVHVFDLKYGRGVEISAADNEQLMTYMLAALFLFQYSDTFEKVVLHIVQPRRGHIDCWETTVEYLNEFKLKLQKAIAVCEAAEADLQEWHFSPSEKACQFCPARGKCPALAQYVTSAVWDDYVDISQPLMEPMKRELDSQMLGNAMRALPLIKIWMTAIEEEAYRRLEGGEEVDGFKRVMGRQGNRAWGNESLVVPALIEALADDAFERKLISPTSAEKILKRTEPDKWESLQQYITRSDGKPTIVPMSDKRPSIDCSFDVVEGN